MGDKETSVFDKLFEWFHRKSNKKENNPQENLSTRDITTARNKEEAYAINRAQREASAANRAASRKALGDKARASLTNKGGKKRTLRKKANKRKTKKSNRK
jgi:uncharacterized protein with von Willebrand factor type A (vWA) domain